MKKFFIFAFAAITALATWGQTNLALNQPAIATSGAAQVGNDGSNDSRWESGHGVDPQNWQVDLGEAQTFNSVVILWEGAYGKSFQILAGDNVDADGWLTDGEVVAEVTDQVLAGFPYKQVLSFDAVTHRYVQFHGIARGTGYGYSFWEFEVYNLEEELKVTSLSIAAERTNAVVGDNVNFTVTAKDQMGGNIEPGTLTWSSTNPAVGTVTDGVFTALAAGTTVISVTAGDVTSNEVTMNVAAEAVPAPTANANEPTDLELNVIAIYSATYGKGLQDNNPGWGIGGGAPNPLYSSIEEVALVDFNIVGLGGVAARAPVASEEAAVVQPHIEHLVHVFFPNPRRGKPVGRHVHDDGVSGEKFFLLRRQAFHDQTVIFQGGRQVIRSAGLFRHLQALVAELHGPFQGHEGFLAEQQQIGLGPFPSGIGQLFFQPMSRISLSAQKRVQIPGHTDDLGVAILLHQRHVLRIFAGAKLLHALVHGPGQQRLQHGGFPDLG